jgi:hypothetical protein
MLKINQIYPLSQFSSYSYMFRPTANAETRSRCYIHDKHTVMLDGRKYEYFLIRVCVGGRNRKLILLGSDGVI